MPRSADDPMSTTFNLGSRLLNGRLASLVCWALLIALGSTQASATAQSETSDHKRLDELLDEPDSDSEDTRSRLREIESLGLQSPDAIPRIVPYLENDDAGIRGEAAGAFLALGGSKQTVWRMTEDPSGWARLGAARALLNHGVAPRKLLPLMSDSFATLRAEIGGLLIEAGLEPAQFFYLLKDEDYEVRESIGVALVNAKVDPQTVLPLLTDEIEDVRLSVALALAEHKVERDSLKPLLRDELPRVRSEVGVAICNAFGPVPELTQLLRDEDANVRSTIGVTLIEADCDEERVWFLLDDDAKSVRNAIAYALLVRLSPNRERLLDTLQQSDLLDEDMCQSLGRKSREYLIPRLIVAEVEGSLSAEEKLDRFRCLNSSSGKWLLPLLRSPFPRVASRAFELLGTRTVGGEKLIHDQLRTSLRGDGPESQSLAIELVKRHELRQMIPDVIEVMVDTESDTDVKIEAALTIAKIEPTNTACIDILLQHASKHSNNSLMYEQMIAANGPRFLRNASTLKTAMDLQMVKGTVWRRGMPETGLVDSDYIELSVALIRSGGAASLTKMAEWLQAPDTTAITLKRLLNLLMNWDGDIAPVAPAVASLISHADESVREFAVVALASNRVPLNAKLLIPLLDKQNPRISQHAARLLKYCKPTDQNDVATAFEQALKREEVVIKAFAVRWLARQKAVSKSALDAFYKILLVDEFDLDSSIRPAFKAAVAEAVSLLDARAAKALAEVAKVDDNIRSITEKAFSNHTNNDQLRELIEHALLNASDNQTRAEAAKQLRWLNDKRSLPALTKSLSDDGDYWYSISNHVGMNAPLRSLSLQVIADIGPLRSMEPKLAKHLFEPRTRREAAIALGAIGPAASNSLPILKRLYDETKDTDLALAVAQIETNEAERIRYLRRALNAKSPRFYRLFADLPIDRILEIGPLAKHLIPDLRFMVEEHELIHRDFRSQAAYALAILEPDNPKWRNYLVEQSKRDEYDFETATKRLEQLEKRQLTQHPK